MATNEITEFWKKFCEQNANIPPDQQYQVWFFGNSQAMSTELVQLVIDGKKTATASLVSVNQKMPDIAPILDGYSVVTDMEGTPKCIIRTVEIQQMPFEEVDEQFAFDEGEGDRTLDHWRDVHQTYFSGEARENGVDFSPQSMICCERFKLLYYR